MIDKSKEHTFFTFNDSKVVKYFDRYCFWDSAQTLQNIKEKDSPYSFTKEEILTASIVAGQFNDKYVKTSGAFDIVEGEFMKTAFSNKDILIGILTKYVDLVTDKDRKKATEILDYLDNEFAFKILSETLTDFEGSISKFLSNNSEDFLSVLGVAAYIPTYYDNNIQKQDLKDRSTQSGHLGKIGEKVTTEIEVLSSKYIAQTQYGGAGYMVNAITTDNHRLSFFTINEDIANSKSSVKVSCKIKSQGTAWKDDNVNETKINYVRMV